MARFKSYKRPLAAVLRYLAARNNSPLIVEYGPEKSTRLMQRILPQARIMTVEHNFGWYRHNENIFSREGSANITQLSRRKDDGYVEAPLSLVARGEADLV